MAKRQYKYYEILGISKDASPEEIRRAFRDKAFKTHPDRNSDKDTSEKFKLINEANRILGDPKTRVDYDTSPAECPVCYTHEVIQTIELLYRCRHCGCQFNATQTIDIIEKVERAGIPGKLKEAIRAFQTTQCSYCSLFYTNEPFLCPFNRLQSNCPSCRKLSADKRQELLGEQRWWWRMNDMLKQVQDKGMMTKCRMCFSLNPNPQKITCWNCEKDGLSCPGCEEKPFLRYDLTSDVWKCINNSHGKFYKYVQKKAVPNYDVSEKKCPNCQQNLYWDPELWLWRCQNKSCLRIYTQQDLGNKPQDSGTQRETREEIFKERKENRRRTEPTGEETTEVFEKKNQRAKLDISQLITIVAVVVTILFLVIILSTFGSQILNLF
jgi:hypothetical protein